MKNIFWKIVIVLLIVIGAHEALNVKGEQLQLRNITVYLAFITLAFLTYFLILRKR